MARPHFNRIVNEVTNHHEYFRNNIDCTGKEGIFSLLKCISAIRQLAYGVNVDFLDEYLQMSERSSRVSLDHFCKSIMKIFGPKYLRKPTVTDVAKFYRHREEKHGHPRIRALEIPLVANDVTYPWGYYLVDGIYSELATLVKKIPEPADDDHKRILYKLK
nr:hypothetical protein [Tanacetum cinerariifolium]